MYLNYSVRKFITLKIVTTRPNALLHAIFPLLEAHTKLLFFNAFKWGSQIFLNVLHT